MRFEREMTDGSGKKFRVVVYVREEGAVFERAILALANKARASGNHTAKAAGGIVVVEAHPVVGGMDEFGSGERS
jgi:hypothetical protein